jgi:hypothetical protein
VCAEVASGAARRTLPNPSLFPNGKLVGSKKDKETDKKERKSTLIRHRNVTARVKELKGK